MTLHTRSRPFNTRESLPKQMLSHDPNQGVDARETIEFLPGQVSQDLEFHKALHISDTRLQKQETIENTKPPLVETGTTIETVYRIVFYLKDIRYRKAVYQDIDKWLKGIYPLLYWHCCIIPCSARLAD